MRGRFALPIVLFIFLLGCSSACLAQLRVACVGDSITAGWKLKEADKYVTKLGGLLGSGYDVQNFGHSARTMLRIADKSYWDSDLFQAAQDFQPDIVTIMLGTNDAHPNYWPLFQAEYSSDYLDMIAVFQSLPSNPKVFVLGLPYLKPGSRYDGVMEINALLPAVVTAAVDVDFIDIWNPLVGSGLTENQLMKDPIHPSAAAHTIMAETIQPFIEGLGSSCGDGSCSAGEDSCFCPEDCGSPPTTEGACGDLLDNDCDSLSDCDDSDCSATQECQSACNDDGVCGAGEDCSTCPNDCAGKRNGRPSGRYCCGNEILEGPELEGICEGVF